MEAVSNSLQSIAANKTQSGLIRVEIERDMSQQNLALAKEGQEPKALRPLMPLAGQ